MVDGVSTRITVPPAGWVSAARLRLVVFLAIAGFMLAGPMVEQVLGKRSAFWRSWTMFSGIGIGMIEVSFASRKSDGALVPVDRFATLGARPDGKLRRIEDREELATIISRVCAALGAGADLRVTARQATREGWQIIRTDAQNACVE